MFTVVIPLFDKRPWIQRALDSVYEQSIEQAAVPEIIVVNDGSTDGGDALAKSQADPRVRVIDQPNRGVSAARNAGIAAAGQPFVAFLDADDRWRPGFLARMRELIAAHPGAVLYGSGFTTIANGQPGRRHGIRGGDVIASRHEGEGGPAGPVDFFRAWSREHVVHASGMVVPKAAAVAVGGFQEGLAHCEDHLFLTKLGLAGPVVLTAEPLIEYDVTVPGQFIEYWRGPYQKRFDVLEYHRFLAEELRRRAGSGVAATDRSFVTYARQQLRTAVLQRLAWGNFSAVDRLWRDLALDDLGLGWPAALGAWAARTPLVQPPVGALMRATRSIRGLLTGRSREAGAT